MLEIPGAAICIVFVQRVNVCPRTFPFRSCFNANRCNGGNIKIPKAARNGVISVLNLLLSDIIPA